MATPKKANRNAAIPDKPKWIGRGKTGGKPLPKLKGHAQKARKGHNM
jgi:hypothetical protein